MSEVYPKFNIKAGTPIDSDRMNENFREVVQEINGNLSENNFAAQSIESDRIAAGALMRFHKFYEPGAIACQRSDVTVPLGTQPYEVGQLPNTAPNFSTTRGGCVNIPLNNSWITIAQKNITARSGIVWVMASWQQTYNMPNGVETVASASSAYSRSEEESIIPHESPDRYRFFPGVQYCLAIDGARIAETTVGGLDAGNDQYGDSYALWHAAGATDMIFPISAGNRTITLEARVPMANTNHPQFSSDHCFYTIASRELIILEMY